MQGAARWVLGCAFLVVAAAHAADDWPQFRGPNGTAVADQAVPAVEWADDKNIAWKVAIPGGGWSTPIVSGDRVLVTTAVSDKVPKPVGFNAGVRDMRSLPGTTGGKAPDSVFRFEVHCLDRATGKTLWKRVAAEKKPLVPAHPSNSYATESPASDGERVYVYFGVIGLVRAFDRNGEPLWSREVGAYPMTAGFGTGSSLALDAGRLFVQCDNEEKSFLLALDAKTGKELWKAERNGGKSAWSTPLVWKNKVRTEVVACGSGKVTSYDPATGKELWTMGGLGASFTSSPAADAERVYFGNSSPLGVGALNAVKAGATGDLTAVDGKSPEGVAWSRPRSGPGMASPVAYDGRLYVLGQGGFLFCYDAATGEPIYKERLPGARTIAASPWVANGKLYILDESGQTFVVKTGKDFEILKTNKLDDIFWSTPSVAGDTLLIRGVEMLFCVRP